MGTTEQSDASTEKGIADTVADAGAPAPQPGAEESEQFQDRADLDHTDSQIVAPPKISKPSEAVARQSHGPRVTTRPPQLKDRGAIGNQMKPRVDKLRRVSNIVLDEALYDSSLRFVLIAIILFALFLVLLFLSKWIG